MTVTLTLEVNIRLDTYRWTRAEIDLDALWHNLTQFRNALGPQMKIMAVVKANGYGHGAVRVAEETVSFGIDYLAVAFLDEALELRRHGIDAPILILGYTPPEGVAVAKRHRMTLTVFDEAVLAEARRLHEMALSDEPPLNIHIKIDTGMGRLGLVGEDRAIQFIQEALVTSGVTVEGLYTHYACADESDKNYTLMQMNKFKTIVDHFHALGVSFPVLHAGNTATGIDMPNNAFNMLRLGIGMYGLYPSEQVNHQRVQLQPMMSLKTEVVMVKRLPPGSGVSYGARYVTAKEETIATLPIGYADGYSRMHSGKAEALLRGKRVPIVGNICMDQCMIRIDDVEVAVGDEIVLLGQQGAERISADELAAQLGTISYEITCMVSHRVPRVYYKHGRQIEFANPLLAANELEHFTKRKNEIL